MNNADIELKNKMGLLQETQSQLAQPDLQMRLGLTPETQLKSFIHDTRKALKMSQRELSKKSGVNQSNLSKIENGIINPSIATIQKVAACLGHKVELRFVPCAEESVETKH